MDPKYRELTDARHVARIASMTSNQESIYLVGLSSGGRVAFDLSCQLCQLGYHVPLVCVCDILPTSGYHVLSRVAWLNGCRSTPSSAPAQRIQRRLVAEARMAAGGVIQWVARRPWIPVLRMIVRIGLRVMGNEFASGAKAAISQSQIPSWKPPLREDELLHVVSKDTLRTFPHLPPTLGWERHARRVRVMTVPGDHWSYFREPHATSFAQQLAEESPVPGAPTARPPSGTRRSESSRLGRDQERTPGRSPGTGAVMDRSTCRTISKATSSAALA